MSGEEIVIPLIVAGDNESRNPEVEWRFTSRGQRATSSPTQ